MPRRRHLLPLQQLSEISNTPLIDLSMLLLVTFLITYPLMEQGIYVNLPRNDADALKTDQPHAVTVSAKGEIFLDDHPVTLAQLEEQAKTLVARDPEVILYVRGDKDNRYEVVVDVLNALRQAKVTRMALVTQGK
jgi:biopolymer transport protein ExbD